MIDLDGELAEEYLAESREHLDAMETDLLALEKGGAEADGGLINRVFRAVHSIKGGANVFDLVKIHELAHQTEEVLALIRSGEIVSTPGRAGVLLGATDKLHELFQNPGASNQADIAAIMAALARVRADSPAAAGRARESGGQPRMLLVEDDFACRLLLQSFLSRYGECHVAVNGREAVEAFRSAFERGQRYDLICMDIMMPEMDGREAVRQVRALEEAHGVLSSSGVKIIMTTTVDDLKEIIRCFKELCDAYLMKPIDLAQLLVHMRSWQLVR
ncbi:MAG: response regulator [Bryobacteraceae bacterium]|jgi:two-component system chemotaxis response regulator CheY